MYMFTSAVAITPNDSTDLPGGACEAIYCGTGGSVILQMDNSSTGVARADVTFANLPAGTVLPVRANRVKTGGTATGLIALR